MLRNLRALRDGKKILGLPYVGVLGLEVPNTGDDGRASLSYNDVQVNNLQSSRVRIWISSHTFPSLFVDDYGYWSASGLTDGIYTADGVLIVDGVDQGPASRVLTVQVGANPGISTAAPFSVPLAMNAVAGAYSIGNVAGPNYTGTVINFTLASTVGGVDGIYEEPEAVGLTPIEFTFVLPTGIPVIDARVELQLTGSGFNSDMTGILMPRPFEIILDSEGKATLPLWPTSREYVVTAEDNLSEAVIVHRFIVPAVSVGTTLRLQDLILPG